MRKLMILGCGGYVGSHLVERLLACGAYEIEGWDVSSDKIVGHLQDRRLTFHRRYLNASTTRRELEPLIGECDAVISLAALCTPAEYVSNPVRTIQSNFIDSYSLVDLCSKHQKWLVHASTSEVYGRTLSSYVPGEGYGNLDLYEQREDETPLVMGPTINQRWSYASAKQLLERYIIAHHKEHGLPYTIVRPYNWFGPRMDFIPGRDGEGVPRVLACFMAALLEGRPMELVEGGCAYRTITYIGDAMDALLLILERPGQSRDQVFNLGNRESEVTIYELACLMREVAAEITGRGAFRDHPIASVSAQEFYGSGYEDCDRRVPAMRKAESLLGWRPQTSLRDTLRLAMRYYFDKYGRVAA